MIPMVAKVTTTPGARLHLDEAGHAHCGSGDGRTIDGTAIQLADANPSMLCIRCLPAIRAAADEAIRDAAGGGQSQFRRRSIEPLRRVRDAIRTDAEKAKADEVRARWQATRTPRPDWTPSVFGQIKAGHAAANQPALIAA